MKQLLVVALALSMSFVARAADPATTGKDEPAVRKLEQSWFAAIAKADVAGLNALVPNDDCVYVDPTGQKFNIRDLIADVKAGNYVVTSAHIDDMKIAVYGDTAVVFGLETEKSKYKGEDMSGQYRFTDTWVKRKGQWVCVASANVKVTPPAKP
jgi:uncharacterized protein (TIGR02246 family)